LTSVDGIVDNLNMPSHRFEHRKAFGARGQLKTHKKMVEYKDCKADRKAFWISYKAMTTRQTAAEAMARIDVKLEREYAKVLKELGLT
jgi:hypothetical protein